MPSCTNDADNSLGGASGSPSLLIYSTPDDYNDLVALSDGLKVVRRFTSRILDRERGLWIVLRIVMKGTTARIESAHVHVTQSGDVGATGLAAIPWVTMVDAAVAHCAWEVTPDRGWRAEYPDILGEPERVHAAAVRARRARVTPDLLRDVLALYESDGIHDVMTKFNYSERNARRLVARARREVQ